jgi:DNA-binding response OmpR family regulator
MTSAAEQSVAVVSSPVMPDRVLLVEDDHSIRSLLRMLFEDHGFLVSEAADGSEALAVMASASVDLVILDLRLPGMSGFDVCREIRQRSRVPIIIVSAQQDTHDIVVGLELGADDYVTKPYNDRELLARVRVQLRTIGRETAEHHVFGDIELRPSEGVVLKAGAPAQLTRTEFHLLCQLAGHEGQVLSRSQLLDAVWDYPADGDGRLVDTHVARLRAKIESTPSEPRHLITVRGLGYKLVR